MCPECHGLCTRIRMSHSRRTRQPVRSKRLRNKGPATLVNCVRSNGTLRRGNVFESLRRPEAVYQVSSADLCYNVVSARFDLYLVLV